MRDRKYLQQTAISVAIIAEAHRLPVLLSRGKNYSCQ
jgi:hypothetical protein